MSGYVVLGNGVAVLQRCKGGPQENAQSLPLKCSVRGGRGERHWVALHLFWDDASGKEMEVGAEARELVTRGVWRIFGRERPSDGGFPEKGHVWER